MLMIRITGLTRAAGGKRSIGFSRHYVGAVQSINT